MGKIQQKDITTQYKILEFKELGDERGNLVVIEGGQQIPFDIKRVFYMYGTDSTMVRGKHANIYSEFVLVNVAGTSKVKIDNGRQQEIVTLDKPRMGLWLDKMVWKEMFDFSDDSVLLVLSNEHYNGDEYIRDYDDYLKIITSMEV